MRRCRRGGGKVIVVADFEGVEMLLDFLFIFGFVGGDEGDLLPVGTPRELLDAVGHLGEAMRFPAGHRQDEELELGIFRGGVDGLESEAVSFGRPARRADAFAIVRQSAWRSARDVDDQQVAIGAVLIEIDTRTYEGNRFSVGRNLRVGDGSDFGEVVELDGPRGRNSLSLWLLRGGGRLAWRLCGEARGDYKQKRGDDQRKKKAARDARTRRETSRHLFANFSG